MLATLQQRLYSLLLALGLATPEPQPLRIAPVEPQRQRREARQRAD